MIIDEQYIKELLEWVDTKRWVDLADETYARKLSDYEKCGFFAAEVQYKLKESDYKISQWWMKIAIGRSLDIPKQINFLNKAGLVCFSP